MVIHQSLHRLGGNCFNTSPYPVGCVTNKMPHQIRDILGPVAQGGQSDGKNIESIEQIDTKRLFRDQLRKILIGGGDHPDVGAHRAGAAHPFEFALL
jgi:hypothetical protein